MAGHRYLIMAMPSVIVADRIEACVSHHGLTGKMGDGEAGRANWHQSLSDRYWPGQMQDLENKLQRALNVLVAYPAKLAFHRIVSDNEHCWIEADGTKDFRALLLAIKRALATQGLDSPASNRPHISLSYWGAAAGLAIEVEAIDWVIDRVFAVEGRKEGRKYCYNVIASISLRAPPPKAEQQDLF